MDHVADAQQITSDAGLRPRVPVLVPGPGPCDILGRDEMAVLVLGHVLDPDARGTLADLEHHGGVPAVDVARDLGLGQRLAPGLLAAIQKRGIDPVDRPAPAALIAVEVFQRAAERARGHALQVLVHRGAHGITAGKEIVLAVLRRELAADLVGEVVPRRLGGAVGLDMPPCTVSSGAAEAR